MVDLRIGWLMENPLKIGDFWVYPHFRKAPNISLDSQIGDAHPAMTSCQAVRSMALDFIISNFHTVCA